MKTRLLALCLAAGILLTGCAGSSSSEAETTAATTTTTTETTAAPVEVKIDDYDKTWEPADPSLDLQRLNLGMTTDDMLRHGIMQVGNRARLGKVMKRARDGGGVTIGVIGGSITQGTGASSSAENYAAYNMTWWIKTFPKSVYRMDFVNAGIGATGSYIGVHRAADDLLAKKPDVVVVEFSVNDTNAKRDYQSYNSLVRHILEQDNDPAVILLFTTQENGTSLVDTHRKIGEAYDLPMISYKNAIMPEIEAGRFTWKDISPDNIHPNSKGHGIIGELLWAYYNSVYADLDWLPTEDLSFPSDAITEDRYQNAKILNSVKLETAGEPTGFVNAEINPYFPHNYETSAAGEISFTVEAQNIGVLYQRTTDGKSGQYDVYVDGEYAKTLDGNFENGWGSYAEAEEVFTSWAKNTHTVTIKMASGSKAEGFQLLGLLISE